MLCDSATVNSYISRPLIFKNWPPLDEWRAKRPANVAMTAFSLQTSALLPSRRAVQAATSDALRLWL